MSFVIVAVEFAKGTPCPHAGQYLQLFDHDRFNGQGYGEFTLDINKAKTFESKAEAMEFWRRQSTVLPIRSDGKPNRPLTSLTVIIEPVENPNG